MWKTLKNAITGTKPEPVVEPKPKKKRTPKVKVEPIPEPVAEAPVKSKTKKPRTEKELATLAGKSYINVLKLDLDVNNPRRGGFELDWNEFFILELRRNGYKGDSDEVIVDQWFQDICRHIVLESYEQDQANGLDNVRYISRTNIGDGKTEVS